MKHLTIVAILTVLVLQACAVGPYEDIESMDEPQGAGVLTGTRGEFSWSEFKKKNQEGAKLRQQQVYSIGSPIDLTHLPPMTEEQFKEFERFKMWLRSREEGSDDYKEYQNWRAYQQYRLYQLQQDSQNNEMK